jgi:mRNA-decapping enzyme subunit 2
VREDDPLTETGLAVAGEEDGWDEDAMFKANEKILGRKITYDGNPHHFAENGFDGFDPHAFHVVGGSFMNSGGITKLAPAPQKSKLQPLFCKENTEDGLQPFFSEGGETPWGEVVSDVLSEDETAPTTTNTKQKKAQVTGAEMAPNEAGQALLKILQKGGQPEDADDVFMTDAEITARSQKDKLEVTNDLVQMKQERQARDKKTADSLLQWVKDLPKVPATSRFGDFRFDVDAIMNAMDLGVKS